jgi:mono/diheme cytochrome c family protein
MTGGSRKRVTPIRSAIAVLVFGVIGLAVSGARSPSSTGSLALWTPASHESLSGAELYQLSCAKCHGKNLEGKEGKGGPALGAGSDAVDHSDDEITEAVFMGEDEMPALQGALTPAEVRKIISYLREVQAS